MTAGARCSTAMPTGSTTSRAGDAADSQAFSESMLMGMAWRPLGIGTLGLRGMLSLDPIMGPDRLSRTVSDRRDRERPHAAGRPPASARLLHGAGGELQRPAVSRQRRVRLSRAARRASARAADLHAPVLGCRQSRGAAAPSLARFDPCHDGRDDGRRHPGPLQARGLGVSRPRARPASLGHRDAESRLRLGAAVLQPDRGLGAPGQLRPSHQPGASCSRGSTRTG